MRKLIKNISTHPHFFSSSAAVVFSQSYTHTSSNSSSSSSKALWKKSREGGWDSEREGEVTRGEHVTLSLREHYTCCSWKLHTHSLTQKEVCENKWDTIVWFVASVRTKRRTTNTLGWRQWKELLEESLSTHVASSLWTLTRFQVSTTPNQTGGLVFSSHSLASRCIINVAV